MSQSFGFLIHLSKGAASQSNSQLSYCKAGCSLSSLTSLIYDDCFKYSKVPNQKKGRHLIPSCDCTKQDPGLHSLLCLRQQSHRAPSGHTSGNGTGTCPVCSLHLYLEERCLCDFAKHFLSLMSSCTLLLIVNC